MSQCRGINHRAFFKHWPPVEETPRLPCRTRGTAIANPCASDARGGDLGKKLWAPEGFPHQGPVPSTPGDRAEAEALPPGFCVSSVQAFPGKERLEAVSSLSPGEKTPLLEGKEALGCRWREGVLGKGREKRKEGAAAPRPASCGPRTLP